jgi:hypothetical protein
MIFAIHPDGNIYPAREMLEALEYAQRNFAGFIEKLSTNVSNSLQI